jgi:hypothetical protein
MATSELLNNLEIGGWSAIFLICSYGFYKIILARGFASKCGFFSVDLRSKEARLLEIQNKQEIDMRKLDIEEMLAKAEVLKYQSNNNDNSREKTATSSGFETDSGSRDGQP